MKPLFLALPGNEELAQNLAAKTGGVPGAVATRKFPDGETYLRVGTECAGRDVVVAATLDRPDDKIAPLLFLAGALRDLGAASVGLAAPYLAYMRQDRAFLPGESVTSRHFAALLSRSFDGLVTVDPHLHRYRSLGEIYTIPTRVIAAAPFIAGWLKDHLENFALIGPDEESRQWVAEVAALAGAPFAVLEKKRRGDRDVEISLPPLKGLSGALPVLIDDIISSGKTLIETAKALTRAGFPPPVCVAVHGVFAPRAYEEILASGVARVVTANTIPHPSNDIDLTPAIAAAITQMLSEKDD